MLIPVPPSTQRAVQPVTIIAKGIGVAIGLAVVDCITTTRPTTQLKGVTEISKRQELVTGLYAVNHAHVSDKNILLFDDLFRSGTTMNAITDVLLQQGRASSVRAFTITRTRSNQ